MFENDDPTQRENLIKALTSLGMDAWELNSGGGTMHVIVTLFDYTVYPPVNAARNPTLRSELQEATSAWPAESYLYLATNSLQTECEIGLMGVDGRTGAQVSLEEWKPVSSIEEAIDAIQQLWNERDTWLRRYLSGELVAW